VVRDAGESCRARAAEEGVALEIAAPPTAPVLADPALLAQVVLTVLKNAWRRAPPESRVAIELERGDGEWRLTVHDDAPGIPARLQRELFTRLESPPLRKLGIKLDVHLGLTFAKLAARALGGELTLAGDEGEGTSVVLSLPPAPEIRPAEGERS
jgi:signal transduction histidine kinase